MENTKKQNPFAASIGSSPVYFAGRTRIIQSILDSLNDPNIPERTLLIAGTSGIGKTALLKQIQEKCYEQGGWIVVCVSYMEKILDEILQQTYRIATEFVTQNNSIRFSKASAEVKTGIPKILTPVLSEFKFQISWDTVSQPQNSWRIKLSLLLDELQNNDVGLLILIDEAYESDELAELLSAYERLLLEKRKIALVMSSLSEKIENIKSRTGLTLLRRAADYPLNTLSDEETKNVLSETAKISGKSFTEDALAAVTDTVRGFPYFMQLAGHYSFEAAGDQELIDLNSAKEGIDKAKAVFRNTILQQEVKELSPGDLKFLLAMTADKDQTEISAIQERTEWDYSQCAQYRRRLVKKGIIESPGRGYVSFAIPEFREYLIDEYM